MKKIIAPVLLLTALISHAGIAGFFTQNGVSWRFIQSVGGMKISQKENNLIIDCDVSGLRKVTVNPSTINSAKAVRKVRHQLANKKIQITLVTCVIEKGLTTSAKPVDLSKYPPGKYEVEYLNPDKTTQPLGTVTVLPAKDQK